MKSNELIQRYFSGMASDDEVHELENRLRDDEELQDEFLLQSELDAHLRQEVQLGNSEVEQTQVVTRQSSSNIWKWVSGISTLAATILLTVIVLNFPPQKTAQAYPSLGEFSVNVSWTERSIWVGAGQGDLEMLRGELRNGVPVDAKLYGELTPLHVSALFDQATAAQLLSNEGADITLTDKKGNTALHMAAFLGNTEVVKVLLSARADPTVRNELGFNTIDLVATPWNDDIEEYLHTVEKELHTTLDLERIRAERPKVLKLLISADGMEEGDAPDISIFQAAIVGNSVAVAQHIAAGTDLNQTEDFGGSTPLMLAAIYGHTEIARSLIEAGADLELRNNSGGTALHQACFFCRPEIVKLLLKSGADPNKTNSRNLTPLYSVTIELNAELRAVYGHVYDSLYLEFDLDDVKAMRPQIADMLRKHVGSKAGENGNREIETAK